jgi:tetratricopeptide (TPR) repeat protein
METSLPCDINVLKEKLVEFHFVIDVGFEKYWIINVVKDNGKIEYTYNGRKYLMEIHKWNEFIDKIFDIKIHKWKNRYGTSEPIKRDDIYWGLEMEFSDLPNFKSHGSNSYPKNWNGLQKIIKEYFPLFEIKLPCDIYHQIMVKIISGLTGNYEQDAKHLMAQYKIYENHENYEEISCNIRALMYNLIPNDKAFALKKTINKNHIENTLSKIEYMMQKNDFNKALEMMEILINELEKTLEIFSDDDINEFHNFDVLFEDQIYLEIFKPMRKMRQMPWNFASTYCIYGVILVELKNFDKAKIFLEKANKINPINTDIMFELSEISKINKNWKEYIKITNKCLEYAYSSEKLARCYRNYGYYFIEQNDYETAAAAYCIASIFSFGIEKKFPQLEMQHIRLLTGKTYAEIIEMLQNNLGEMAKKLKKYNIQLGANKTILTLALTLAMHTNDSVKENCIPILRDIARYKEIYDLVGDEEINAIVEMVISIDGKLLRW